MIENYIFDFDGTVADTANGIIKTMQETFRIHGKEIPLGSEIKKTIGLQLLESIMNLGNVDEGEANLMCRSYRRLFPYIATQYIELFPQVKDTITALREKKKRIAIATSRSEASLIEILESNGLGNAFENIVSATDNLPSKPAPDMVECLLERMDIDKSSTLVVGDTTYDIEMGNAAGCLTCAVTYGNHDRMQLLSSHPNFVIDNFGQLLIMEG